MHLVDWRDPSLPSFSAMWGREAARWRDRLGWDSTRNWNLIEQQRRSGRLPGLVLLHDRTIAGWTFFVVHQNTLQIGGFDGGSEDATGTLLDAIVATAEPAVAPDGVLFFAFSDAPGLPQALDRRHFDREHYLYLVRPLDDAPTPAFVFGWGATTQHQLAALFARAYGEPCLTRPFVRHGHALEWQEYAAQLVQLNACGEFQPDLSTASPGSGNLLEGAVLTTAVNARTAHVAQVSVDPGCRGRGLAAAMLREVFARARARGFDRVSLLVGERNQGARELYRKLGFVEVARFTSAGRGAYPRLSTSPAADTGGASTLR